MSEEVFCINCAFLQIGYGVVDCLHPENIIKNKVKDWYNDRETIIYKMTPNVLNIHNDCKWYKKMSMPKDKGQGILQ